MTTHCNDIRALYDKKIEFILSEQLKQPDGSNKILNIAISVLEQFHRDDDLYLQERISSAYIVYKYMTPNESVVASLLLYPDYKNELLSHHFLKEKFGEDNGNAIFDIMRVAVKEMKSDDIVADMKSADCFLMMHICDIMFGKLLRTMNKKGAPDVSVVWNAYKVAKENHMGQLRKTGEPFIVHPLKVAMILSEIDVESNIIAAAILHDVVAVTDYTIENIKNKFGEQIAKYVYAVTSVEKECAVSMDIDDYARDKSEMNLKTFERLVNHISKDPRMIFALYIKAADRIHNLRTIDDMDSINRHNQTDETDTLYLPLFKRFNLNYFSKIIEDLTWRANNMELYNSIRDAYDNMYDINSNYIKETKDYFRTCFDSGFVNKGQNSGSEIIYDVEVVERKYCPLEIFNMIKNNAEFYETPVKYVKKRYMPVCDFDIIVDAEDEKVTIGAFTKLFFNYYVNQIASTGRIVTDFYKDEWGRFIVNIEDPYRNNIRCCFSMKNDYITYRNGSARGVFVGNENYGSYVSNETNEVIHVRLRNNQEIELPKGASVIDVAFAIHEEIGFSVKGATVNGKEAHVYHILRDGDKVIVDADTIKEDDVLKYYVKHARITWLEYAKTSLARKKLIRFLSDKYEGDDPVRESDALAKAVDNVSENMLNTIDVNPKPGEENF